MNLGLSATRLYALRRPRKTSVGRSERRSGSGVKYAASIPFGITVMCSASSPLRTRSSLVLSETAIMGVSR